MDTDSPNALSRRCPYIGLLPFGEKDAEFFFGRTADIEIVATNLRAAPLTVFYGSSGVGKSSLLNAGVVPYLRRMSTASTPPGEPPEYILVTLRDWANDPIQGLKIRIAEAVYDAVNKRLLPKGGSPEDLTDVEAIELLSLDDVTATSAVLRPVTDLFTILKTWTDFIGTSLIIILDQFEDFFLHRRFAVGPGSFGEEFPKVVNNRELPVHFMLSLRDDALSKLDFFKGRITDLTRNTLRLDHLNREATIEAIKRPIEKYNELTQESFSIEDSLVEQLLEDLQVDRIKFETQGQANVDQLEPTNTDSPIADKDYRVETPYLQLVMVRLWEHEDTQATKCLAYDTLTSPKKLGGVEEVVRTYLDKVLDEFSYADRELLAEFIHFTVTRTGTKIPSSAAGLSEWAQKPDSRDDIERILTTLSTGQNHIFRTVENLKDPENRYYIVSHDALAPAILSWRTRYLDQVNSSRLLLVRKWAWRVIPPLLLVIVGSFVTLAWIAITAVNDAANANVQAQDANSRADDFNNRLANFNKEREDHSQAKVDAFRGMLINLKEEPNPAKRNEALDELRGLVASGLTDDEVNRLKIELANTQLDEANARLVEQVLRNETVKIHMLESDQKPKVNEIKKILESSGFKVLPIVDLSKKQDRQFLNGTEVKYFREADLNLAERVGKFIVQRRLQDVKEIKLRYLSKYSASSAAPPGLVELWFANYAFPIDARIAKTPDGFVSLRRTAEVREGESTNEIARLKSGEKVVRQYCQSGAPVSVNGASGRWCWIEHKGRSGKRSEGWLFDAFLDYSVGSSRSRSVNAAAAR